MAKIFYTDGIGSQQTTESAESNRIKVYNSKAEAEADLANLANGEIVSTATTTYDGEIANAWIGTAQEYALAKDSLAPDTVCFIYGAENPYEWHLDTTVKAYTTTALSTVRPTECYSRDEGNMMHYIVKITNTSTVAKSGKAYYCFDSSVVDLSSAIYVGAQIAKNSGGTPYVNVEPLTDNCLFVYNAHSSEAIPANSVIRAEILVPKV